MTLQKALSLAQASTYVPDTKFSDHIDMAKENDKKAVKSAFVQHTCNQLARKDRLNDWFMYN